MPSILLEFFYGDEALSIPGGADETNWKLFKLTIRINIFCFLNKIGLEVDWTEGWLLALLTFHLVTLVTILLLRHHVYLQAVLLVALAVLCVCSEWINEYAALNYSWFSKEQYFDPGGFFILTVFSGPIVINCFIIVLYWMWTAWTMMVRVGVMKARRSASKKTPAPPTTTPSEHHKEE